LVTTVRIQNDAVMITSSSPKDSEQIQFYSRFHSNSIEWKVEQKLLFPSFHHPNVW